jgi:cobalt-zinc-cadmium efflux system outer membrane protein
MMIRFLVFVAALLPVASGVSYAEPSPPQAVLTLGQAIDSALRRNPELLARRYELKAAEARTSQAGSRPNPTLEVEFENFAGSGSASGADVLETTLSMSQVIELGSKRDRRRTVAEADSELIEIDQRARQLDALAEVTQRFIGVVDAQQHFMLAGESLGLAEQTLATIEARVQAARAPVAEVSRAQIAVTRARLDRRQAESALRTARYVLASSWGAEPNFGEAQADLYAFRPLQTFDSLVARIERNPVISRFASEARLRDAELRLARAQARPDLEIGFGVRRFEESDDTALVAGFSMGLPLFDRNQGGIREAQSMRRQSEAERQAAIVRVRAVLYAVYEEMASARARCQSLRDEAIPQALIALEQTKAGYERGRFSFLELLAAQQEMLELRSAAIDAAADYHRLLAELERVTSEPLNNNDLEASMP